MKSIEKIRTQLQSGKFEFTHHDLKHLVERNISKSELMEKGENAIILSYTNQISKNGSATLKGENQVDVFAFSA
jgi:hypothetical protein